MNMLDSIRELQSASEITVKRFQAGFRALKWNYFRRTSTKVEISWNVFTFNDGI